MIPHCVCVFARPIVRRLSHPTRLDGRYGRRRRHGTDTAGPPWQRTRGATIANLEALGRNHRVVILADATVSADSDTAGQARALTHDSHLPSGERVVDVRRIGGHRASGRNLPSIACRNAGLNHARAPGSWHWHGGGHRDDSQHVRHRPYGSRLRAQELTGQPAWQCTRRTRSKRYPHQSAHRRESRLRACGIRWSY